MLYVKLDLYTNKQLWHVFGYRLILEQMPIPETQNKPCREKSWKWDW